MTGQPEPASTQLIFAALSDPTRREMLVLLGEKASSASRLSEPLGISRQAAARHLGILLDAGLARRRRDGREIVFELVPGGWGPATDYIGGLQAGVGGMSAKASESG
ncbi:MULTISPECIES: ArsR/SmtB family transcription factor [Paeniglutamicibacter]|jgi:DNA-binding transcriptional ArsR family regulator|nr:MULTISPECIES: metalloregulator ArsR/SmtB family transcription factor [Paeniglutamicibacter]MCV9994949.1 metalloregulator ArsR/SmtB family transcription factor [Paeniglutamicibacter sp. ZC-3]MDO2932842.1 metalloregulator ArsR/SmtB family transcription factor [Paeniglutamicibacter sulfureus]